MIDLHCHLLPGLDDGPASVEDSLAMARAAVSAGISGVVCTPHQFDGRYANPRRRVLEAVESFRAALAREKIPLEIRPGAEVRLHPELIGRLDRGEILTYGDAGRAILVELPHEAVPPGARELIFQLRLKGLTVVLAHPERNRVFLAEPERLEEFAGGGIVLQVTADSLEGGFGPDVKKLAERILGDGFDVVVATDAHRASGRRSPRTLPGSRRPGPDLF